MRRSTIFMFLSILSFVFSVISGCSHEELSVKETPEQSLDTSSESISYPASKSVQAVLTDFHAKDDAVLMTLTDSTSDASLNNSNRTLETDSIAKRLCGKYSCKRSDEEYYTMDIIEFADNLYAYMGIAVADESSGSIEPYSFWGAELIPDDEVSVKSKTADSVQCHILTFSIMSNLGKYQAPPSKCSLTLTQNGIEFTGPIFTGEEQTLQYVKDERVADAFIYEKNSSAGSGNPSPELIGLWKEKKSESPMYIAFSETGNIKIYKESPGTEVRLSGGEYHGIGDNMLGCTYSTLGCGDMPSEFEAAYSFPQNDELEINITNGLLSTDFELGHMLFEKAEYKDVPVVTMSEVKKVLTDNYVYDLYALTPESYDDGFYGVFVGAYETLYEADELKEKLKEKGYDDVATVFTSEWENLSEKPFYCVAFSRCQSETEAKGALVNAKSTGFKDAYIKFSGKRKLHRIWYTLYSHEDIQFLTDKVILKDVTVSDITGEFERKMTLTIDADTKFDPSCELSFFGNYESGDTVLGWFIKNGKLLKNDPDSYMSSGPALIGIFDVSITGDHIDSYYGSYWWD